MIATRLRYEGDGIIDSNVAEVIKAVQGDKGSALMPPAGAPSGSSNATTEPKLVPVLPGGTAPATGPTLPSIPSSPPPQNNQPAARN